MFISNQMADRIERENYVLTNYSRSPTLPSATPTILIPRSINSSSSTLPPTSFPSSFGNLTLTNYNETSAIYTEAVFSTIYNTNSGSIFITDLVPPPSTISTTNGTLKLVGITVSQLFIASGPNASEIAPTQDIYTPTQTIPQYPLYQLYSGSNAPSTNLPAFSTSTFSSIQVLVTCYGLYQFVPSAIMSSNLRM